MVVYAETLLQGSPGESSPVRTLEKLLGSTHDCQVLQLWQAGRMALMEVQEVLESLGQWLVLTGRPVWALWWHMKSNGH